MTEKLRWLGRYLWRRRGGQGEAHDKAVGAGVVRAGVAAVLGGNACDEGQAEAGAVGGLLVCPPKALKDVFEMFCGYAGAVVGYFEDDGIGGVGASGGRAVFDADGDDAVGGGVA